MSYTLPALSYSYSSLEPFIDAQTMEIHHTKHHQAYINALNKGLEGYPEYANLAIVELIKKTNNLPEPLKAVVKNHGGGHSNHSLFWQMMTPDKQKQTIPVKFEQKLIEVFGSFEKFKELFIDAALKQFGSGWAWLVYDLISKKLIVISMPNQDSPYLYDYIPLLGIDVWEHAYYLKYQNRRIEYSNSWFSIINWDYVNQLYIDALK